VTQEKTRLKFKVSAHDGVSDAGMPEPRWTEKWGVGLFDYEEFHVTDQLLKLPFREAVPKTVCIFSIADGALSFRLLDADRRAEVNGVERADAIVTTGDKIKIGEALTIEVSLAPPKAKSRANAAGPALAMGGEIPKLEPEDGPTLTFSSTESKELVRPERQIEPQIAEPAPSPIFQERSRSIEIQEPSLSLQRPEKTKPTPEPSPRSFSAGPIPSLIDDAKVEFAPTFGAPPHGRRPEKKAATLPPRPESLGGPAGRRKNLIEEPKVELADHAGPDRSLDERMEAMADLTNESIQPLYAKEAKLDARPNFGERILAAIAKILRRDDLNPPEDLFGQGQEEAGEAKPWLPDGIADPGITRSSSAAYGAPAPAKVSSKQEPKPWIPEMISAASRIRGRALVFLVAAIGTLMILVGIVRIQIRISALQNGRKPAPVESVTPERGLPIEVIQDQVRRMRWGR
jgi:hypothetical protein